MKKYLITGGKKLKGTVPISGSKNAALPIMAASLLTDEDIILHNVPLLRDTKTMISLLAMLGKRVIFEPQRIIIRSEKLRKYKATYEIVKQMRASIVVLGPLVAKWGRALVSLPGGCAFGPRPVDLHLKGLKALGIKIEMHKGYIEAKAGKLKGKKINLRGEFGSSVLGTDNVAMTACLAAGTTIIENAAQEPETEDLMRFLICMGADIEGAGTSILRINGQKRLHGCEYSIIPDRIEAGTFVMAAMATGGALNIKYNRPEHLEHVLKVCREIGANIKYSRGILSVKGKGAAYYKPFNVTTMPYPDFPTDLQSLLMVIGCLSPGTSSITEGIYASRFNQVPEFIRLGADIQIEKNTAILKNSKTLEGASIQASDLRAGAALVVAAMAIKGKSEVRRVYHIERGYEHFVAKLRRVGAGIKETRDSIL